MVENIEIEKKKSFFVLIDEITIALFLLSIHDYSLFEQIFSTKFLEFLILLKKFSSNSNSSYSCLYLSTTKLFLSYIAKILGSRIFWKLLKFRH